jgi:hypothetical protein
MKKRVKVEIWYQSTNLSIKGFLDGSGGPDRIRSIKNGHKSRWSYSGDWEELFLGSCCWDVIRSSTLKDKVKFMRKYDKKHGFPPAIKLDEFYEDEDVQQ